MNIWILNHYAVTPDMPGGTRHFDLARELVRRGYQVTIFASSFLHGRHQEMKLATGEKWKVEDVDGVKFVWIKTFPYQRNNWRRVLNMLSYMFRAWRLGRRLPKLVPEIRKPDVIIGSSVHLLAVLAAYRVAKHYRTKFIMEVRDLWPQTIVDMGKMSERNPFIKVLQFLERFLYQKAERIITLLPLAHEYITSLGVSREKIVWIPNGVDLTRFEKIEMQNSSSNGFAVMYLGAHGQNDSLDTILDAAKIIQDRACTNINFIFIGAGPEKPRLIDRSNEMGLKNVEFHEPVSKSKIPNVIKESDVTLLTMKDLPLYRFGFSANKIFDYMASGKPIVLAGDPVNNIVEDTACGLTTPPEDPEAVAEAIIKLYNMSEEERIEMGKIGRNYVEKYHSIPGLVDRLENIFKEVENEIT